MDSNRQRKGRIVVISGPSGVGKSSICLRLVKRLDNVYRSVSVTTRPKAKGEVDGKAYWFVTKEQFQQRIEKGLLLEYAEVFGNLYGTPKDKIEQALQQGKTVILEIDVQGAKKVVELYPDAVLIFILPPNKGELTRRISDRGREKADVAKKRLAKADAEIEDGRKFYQYLVVNNDLEETVNEVVNIIQQNTGGN
jgi:guanylate kinase